MKHWIHDRIPWWAKVGAKLLLSRVPIPAKVWHRMGAFVPGAMRKPDRAIHVFERHWQRMGYPAPGFTYLELGPGESAATAIVAWAFGAAGGTLVDAHDYAAREMDVYRPLIDALSRHPGVVRDVRPLLGCESLDALLKAVNATIRTDGLQGLRAVAADSVDLLFSQAVLEHIPLAEFAPVARELHRVQRAAATGSHSVDFMDHLQHSIHHLRFTRRLWEQPWFAARSGFYTNRLRLSEMVQAFTDVGFDTRVTERSRWPEPPLPRKALARRFRGLSEDDLTTSGAVLLLTKASDPSR